MQYRPEGLAKFDQMMGRELALAYENQKVRVYRVAGGEASSQSR